MPICGPSCRGDSTRECVRVFEVGDHSIRIRQSWHDKVILEGVQRVCVC